MDSSHAFTDSAAPRSTGFGATLVQLWPRTGAHTTGSRPPEGEPDLQSLPTIGHFGRYELKFRLGEGGLGTVHAAFDPLLGRAVALKTLHLDAEPSQRAALMQGLLLEARAAARLNHRHIVTVYDAGAGEHGLYVAMERLQGADLRQMLREGWRPTPLQAARIVRRVADALAYAHDQGIVHCDIKPANIFMVERRSPKVLDFGIARIATSPGDAAASDFAAGSPCYMAPEQLRSEVLDARCDVYALGAVLYELLCGRRAFAGHSLDDLVHAALTQAPVPAFRLHPQVPRALSDIASRAMRKDPSQRYASARQMAAALRQWMAEQPLQQRRQAGERWRRARNALLVGGGLLVIGAASGAAWLWAGNARPGAAIAAAAPQPR